MHSKASENMYIDVEFIVCKALDTVLFNHSTPQGWRNSGSKLSLFTSQMAKYVWPDCYFALDHILYGFLLFIVLMVVWLMNSSWMVFVRHLFRFFLVVFKAFRCNIFGYCLDAIWCGWNRHFSLLYLNRTRQTECIPLRAKSTYIRTEMSWSLAHFSLWEGDWGLVLNLYALQTMDHFQDLEEIPYHSFLIIKLKVAEHFISLDNNNSILYSPVWNPTKPVILQYFMNNR